MITPGKTVKVHYKGVLDDGTVFDSSEGRDPLQFEVGSGQVIPGFDNAIQQMDVGSTKTVVIPSEDAYGAVRPEMIATLAHEQFPEDLNPQVGQMLQLTTPQGELPVQVIEVSPAGVKVDGNHPLAGQTLTFELTIVEAA
ncbi:MAG: peptidylprolyl isomerase [Leptolyngbyaceae cyanobacterium]